MFVGSGGGDRIELESARIQALRQRGDRRALAGSVPTFKDDYGRDALIPAGFLQVVQTLLQSGLNTFVVFACELLIEVDVFQHERGIA